MDKRVAIIFFGLTRSLSQTIESLKENMFNVLKDNSIEFDIFIHTYKINGQYTNEWSGENTDLYINEDVEQLLNPKCAIYDNQQDIINTINFKEYYTNLGDWYEGYSNERTKYLIRNMCLALYSKNRVINEVSKCKDNYNYGIIIRPDLLLINKIDLTYFKELNQTNIIIPEKGWFKGVNDKICIGEINTVLYCGSLFNKLKEYSTKQSINSEKFLKDMLNKEGISIIKKNIDYNTLRINYSKAKCMRDSCKYTMHINIKNNGGTYCCLLCKNNGEHGSRCQRIEVKNIAH
jgi:hypothetical protein